MFINNLTFGYRIIFNVQLHILQSYPKLKNIPLDGTLYSQFLVLKMVLLHPAVEELYIHHILWLLWSV